MADEWKAKGNTALQSNNLDEAIDCYSKAIELDAKLSGQFKGYLSWKEMEAAGQLPRQSSNFNNQ